MSRRLPALMVLACCLCMSPSTSAADELTLEQIMADPDWIGREPESPRWSDDGKTIYYQRKRKGSNVRDWYRRSLSGGRAERLTAKETVSEIPQQGDESSKHDRVVYSHGGDLFIRTIDGGTVRQLTRTAATESSPEFLSGDQKILFRRDGVLLVRHLKSGLEREVAALRTEDKPPEDDAKDKKHSFLTRQESELFEYLQWEEALSDAAKHYQKQLEEADDARGAEPFWLGKGQSVESQELSSNGRWLAVVLSKTVSEDQRGQRDKMPVWVRDEAYVQSRDVRRLVGDDAEPPQRLVLLDLKRHVQVPIPIDSLPEISTDRLQALAADTDTSEAAASEAAASADKDDATSDAKAKPDETKSKPRDVSIRGVEFSDDSQHLLFQCFSTDNKDRWIVSVPLQSVHRAVQVRVLHHRYDEAWINWGETWARWVPETRQVCFLSEATGYSHLYVADAATGSVTSLTSGDFEVSDPHISRDGSTVYFRTNASHPGTYELGSVPLASGEVKTLTTLGGMNRFEISPDETHAVALHSELSKPPELVLVPLSGGGKPKTLTRTTTREFREISWTVPTVVEVPSRHGRGIWSRLYLPQDSGDGSPRRAVVFVHGAGYLQNAHQGWSSYFREFMFHTLLTRRGYVVLDMDYRASAGYGRDWRTAIYRQMGTPELEDLEDGVTWLVAEHNVDAHRVGVYGGSYGGFMTLMALFKSPDLFACGAALRPVTDWAHYNHGYTSNILNTPETDPEAYRRSSPIHFADGLQNPLLICHGMVDDNVFFKDTVRLTQRLIELHKKDWQVAMYPVEPHGFRHPSSWLDEYRRILELFESEL